MLKLFPYLKVLSDKNTLFSPISYIFMSLFKIGYEYLNLCGLHISKSFLEKRLLSHPAYPSLASFTDTLDELELTEGYVVLKTNSTKITELSFPWLAQTPLAIGGYEIVSSLNYYLENKENFLNRWNGIAVMVALKQKSKNKENLYLLNRKQAKSKVYSFIILFLLLILFSIQIWHFHIVSFILTILSLIGGTICFTTILHKLGYKYKISNYLMKSDKYYNCDLLLNNNALQLFNIFDLIDVGLVYFIGLTLFLEISVLSNLLFTSLSALTFISVFPFLITIASVFYQLKIFRLWCRVFLLINLIIWLQVGILIFFLISSGNFTVLRIINSTLALLLSFSIGSIWLVIKSLIKKTKSANKMEIELIRWKRNVEIFEYLIDKENNIDTSIDLNPAIIGRPAAPIQLTIVANPFSLQASTAYRKLIDIYTKNIDSVSINVIFSVKSATDFNDRRNVAIETIINTILIGDNAYEVLNVWFDNMNIASFRKIYPLMTTEQNTKKIMSALQEWANKNFIQSTPQIFFNCYKIPSQYNLDDVESLIPELTYKFNNNAKNIGI